MTLLGSFLQRYGRKLNTTAKINVADMRRNNYSLDWDLLIRMFDLRMWMQANTKSNSRRLNQVHQIEHLHNDLNYLWARSRIYLNPSTAEKHGYPLSVHAVLFPYAACGGDQRGLVGLPLT